MRPLVHLVAADIRRLTITYPKDVRAPIRRLLRSGGIISIVMVALLAQPCSLWACAACYGQSDAPMARAFNWGILSLLGVVVCVLGGFTAFFVYLARRAASMNAAGSLSGSAVVDHAPNTVH